MLKSRIALVTALLFGFGMAVALRAQAPASASTSNDAVAALVAEVRALRTELSQVASASVRSQLLVTRIQLQEQRLMHLDRQRAEVAAKLGEAEKTRVMFAGQVKQLQTQSTQSSDAKEREAAQFVIEGMKSQLQADGGERGIASRRGGRVAELDVDRAVSMERLQQPARRSSSARLPTRR